jgi:hypothetical protein
MSANDEPGPKREPDPDDLVERARKLEERARELEAEEAEVEELERGPREWLEHEPEHYWPPREDEQKAGED